MSRVERTWRYDEAGRLVHASGPEGEVSFAWDAGGNRVAVKGPHVPEPVRPAPAAAESAPAPPAPAPPAEPTPAAPAVAGLACGSCGTAVLRSHNFCPGCGARLQ